MSFFDLDRWNEIWQTLSRNKKRSIMTALGVFWGVFMLVILLGVGLGVGRILELNLGDMSTNTCYLFPNRTSIAYKGFANGRIWYMTNDDLEKLSSLEGVKYISPMVWGSTAKVNRDNMKGDFSISGESPDEQKINPKRIVMGRVINDIDIKDMRKVCVIGVKVAQTLFPFEENIVGETILVNSSYYMVVGVVASKGNAFSFGGKIDERIFIPYTLFQQVYGLGNRINSISITGEDDVDIAKLEQDSKIIVLANNFIAPNDTKAINSFNIGEMFNNVYSILSGISLLTWIVGLGTLLSGIVGVSNIILVLVKERTQEIGIRRALGAKPSIIISQILMESFVLTFIAGFIGLVCAVGVLSIADTIAPLFLQESNVAPSFQVSLSLGLICTAVIVAGSLLAGIIPSSKALSIKAVDALRDE